MRVIDYVKDKLGIILFSFISFVFIMLFVFFAGMNQNIILLIVVLYLFAYLVFWICDYLYLKRKYEKMEHTMDRLKEKYLIADVIKVNGSFQDKFYCEMVRRACKSMMDELNKEEKKNMEYEEYIDNWIHEVKTPITAIQLLCDNERSTVTDKIKLETKKVEMDIERMLYYSKAGEAWKDYIIVQSSLKDIVEASIMKIYQIFIYNNVTINIDLQEETVYTDSKWSSFVITQILLNCVQYKGKRPLVIHIYAQKVKDGTCLIIEDNGLGIKKEEIDKIFQKGYVGTNGRKNEASSGMGMFICRKLCDKLKIGIHADSEYGKYTKMILTYGEGTFYMTP